MTVVKNTKIELADNTTGGTASGDLVRNGALLEYHDGTSSKTISTVTGTQTLTNKTINTANNTLTIAQADVTGLSSSLALKSPLASPTFTGTVVLPNVPAVVTTALNLKSPLASPTFTGTVVLPNVPAIVTTQLNLKSPLASPTFTGTVTTALVDVAGNNIDNIQNLIHDISATGLDIDFAEDQLQTYPTLTGNVTFTTFQNITAGKSKTVRLLADGTDRVCTFPSGIKWVGTAPTSNAHTITASKYAIITFTSFGTTEAEIIGAFALQE